MARLDLFKMNRELADRVCLFVNRKVNHGSIEVIYGTKIKAEMESIANLEKVRGCVLHTDIDSEIINHEEEIERLRKAQSQAKKDCDNCDFKYDAHDLALYNEYTEAGTDAIKACAAILKWLNAYSSVQIIDTEFCYQIIMNIGLTPKADGNARSVRNMVAGKGVGNQKNGKAQFLRSFYNEILVRELSVGLVKLPDIMPEAQELIKAEIQRAEELKEARRLEREAKKAEKEAEKKAMQEELAKQKAQA